MGTDTSVFRPFSQAVLRGEAMADSSDEESSVEPNSHVPFVQAFASRKALRDVSWL